MGWLLHWLAVHTGTVNEGGPYYGFFSGFGSDLSEIAIVGSLVALVRHRNCEVHRCWRLGRHTTAAGHRVCRRHHPDGHLTHEQVTAAAAAVVPVEDVLGAHLKAFDARVKAHCADVKEHVSAVVADGPVKGGAGSNPAQSEGLPAETATPAGPVVPPPATTKRTRKAAP